MTKLDGDARGGAALSVRAVTGKPIIYASTGETLGDFERFHPDRMASRILGMGDVLTFIEKAEKEVDEADAAELQEKMLKQTFTLEDMLKQMKQVRKMGPIGNVLGMLPGMGAMKQLKQADIDERELDRVEAIILSMTPGGAPQPRGDQRLPPPPHCHRLRHPRPGRQPARQAIRPDAQGDEADGLGQHARPEPAGPADVGAEASAAEDPAPLAAPPLR